MTKSGSDATIDTALGERHGNNARTTNTPTCAATKIQPKILRFMAPTLDPDLSWTPPSKK